MNEATQPTWWDLHLRNARGESLSDAERLRYDAELMRQDRNDPTRRGWQGMKDVRNQAIALGKETRNCALAWLGWKRKFGTWS